MKSCKNCKYGVIELSPFSKKPIVDCKKGTAIDNIRKLSDFCSWGYELAKFKPVIKK